MPQESESPLATVGFEQIGPRLTFTLPTIEMATELRTMLAGQMQALGFRVVDTSP